MNQFAVNAHESPNIFKVSTYNRSQDREGGGVELTDEGAERVPTIKRELGNVSFSRENHLIDRNKV